MKRLIIPFTVIALLHFARLQAQWNYTGQPGFSVGASNGIIVATDSSDGVYAAYYDEAYQGVSVAKLINNTWQALGPVASFQQVDGNTLFAVSNNGTPYIAWQADTIMVEKFDYSIGQWIRIDSGILGTGLNVGQSITTDNAGNLYTSFENENYTVYIEKYNGVTWSLIDSLNIGFGNYQIFTDKKNGHPYFGFIDGANNVRLWDLRVHSFYSSFITEATSIFFIADEGRFYLVSQYFSGYLEVDSNVAGMLNNDWIDLDYRGPSNIISWSAAIDIHYTIYVAYTTYGDSTFILSHASSAQNWGQLAFPVTGKVSLYQSLASDKYGDLYAGFDDYGFSEQISVMEHGCTPDIPTLSTQKTEICAGSSTTLQVSSGNLNSAANWEWHIGNCDGDSAGNGQSLQVLPDSTTTYFVLGRGGCTVRDTCASVTITVDTIVNASVTIESNADSICAGSYVTFQAFPVNGGRPNFEWSINSDLLAGFDPELNINTLADGDIVYCRMISSLCAVPDTVISDTIAIHVTPYPNTAIVANGPFVFCANDSVVLNAGNGNYTYNWSSGATNQSITVNNTGIYNVTVSQNGCNSIDSVSLIASDSVLQPQLIPGSYLHVCGGDSVTISAGPGYSTYLWSTGDTTEKITENAAGVYSLTVTQNTCAGTTNDTIDTSAYTIPVQIYPTDNPIYICAPGSITLALNETYASYQWNTGDTTSKIVLNNSAEVNIIVSQFGCRGNDSVNVQFVSVGIPAISFSDTVFTVCHGQPTVITVDSTYDSFRWSSGDTSQTISVANNGIYSVTVSLNGCSASASIDVAVSETSVDSVALDSTWIYQGQTLYVALPDGALSYQWQSVSQLGSTNYSFNATTVADTLQALCYLEKQITEYALFQYIRVISTWPNGCVYTSAWEFNDNCAGGINNASFLEGIDIYPNPAYETLSIDCQLNNQVNLEIAIFDIEGRKLIEVLNDDLPQGSLHRTVNVSNLSAGIYFVLFNSEQGFESKKFVKGY